ncbi:MAG: Dyp-type peroxidase [Pseudohongiellaceae bacterium]|nr:Dyp-type peroxidase [Pseudohongiellaceae bacterium]
MRDNELDLGDIQGNILRAYAFPHARFVQLALNDAAAGQRFFAQLLPLITTAEVWPDEKPNATLNVAISASGLRTLELPQATLSSFPNEFMQGMAERALTLGDVEESSPEHWDEVWQKNVDALVSIYGQTDNDCEAHMEQLGAIAEACGVSIIGSQRAGKLTVDGSLSSKEHFGFTDGIAQPEFKHSHSRHTAGDGKLASHGAWTPLETGDFLIGYGNEAKEIEAYPEPLLLSKNGTFLVYRKLEQDVVSFRQYMSEQAEKYPGSEAKLRAKFVGRWEDGTPVALSPDKADPTISGNPDLINDFKYGDDPEGFKCPIGAHVRRANPRDALGFKDNLTDRRRIIRRGISYGDYLNADGSNADEERGLIFIALNANLSRQFEFVQQQWMNYGNDFHQGEQSDPVIGNHKSSRSYVIPGDTSKGEEPFICTEMKTFVRLCGGDYFFVPSLTGIRLMASNEVDAR